MTRPSRGAVVLLALLAAVVALTVGVVVLLARGRAGAEAEGRDTAVLAAARQTVTNMFTIDGADPKGSLERVADGATGEFRELLVSQTDDFSKAIAGARAASQGSVSEAGIRVATDDQASVLVSAVATLRNDRTPQGQAVQYRMVLELQRKDRGWLVSRLDFVP